MTAADFADEPTRPEPDYVSAHLEHQARCGQRRHDPDADIRATRELPAAQTSELPAVRDEEE